MDFVKQISPERFKNWDYIFKLSLHKKMHLHLLLKSASPLLNLLKFPEILVYS